MKTKVITFFTAVILIANVSIVSAKVWRVNNTPGVNANFSTVAAAITAAAAGDTVYIEGSSFTYGNVTLNKKLVLLGTGYFLTDNDSTQANPNTSKVGNLTISVGAEGSTICGIMATGTATGSLVTVGASNISIIRCYFTHTAPYNGGSYVGITLVISSGVNNVLVTQSFIYQGAGTTGSCSYSYYTRALQLEGNNSGILISNNIIKHYIKAGGTTCGTFYAIEMATTSTAVFNNNVITGSFMAYNSIVTNNIQIVGGANGDYLTSGTYPNTSTNNIGNGSQFGTLNGNKSSVTMTSVFTYAPGNEYTDNHYKLKALSPALGAGVGGIDCGAFGGTTPYILSGMPGIPAIYSATVPVMGTTSTGININIKAKARK
ncbi:MAG: hypothetical protein WCM76_15960 [Bacteroidota bacterium]